MKLLFDENLSPRLVILLADLFPNSVHVRDMGLRAAANLLRRYIKTLETFEADDVASFLSLS